MTDVSTTRAEVIFKVKRKSSSLDSDDTIAHIVEMSITTNSCQDYFHPGNQIPSRYVTPGFNHFHKIIYGNNSRGKPYHCMERVDFLICLVLKKFINFFDLYRVLQGNT